MLAPNVVAESQYPTPFVNSTLFPLLLLSLATQKHAPSTESTYKDEYDYIVVGGGSAGSVVAGRLSEKKCVKVLLLEAGKSPPMVTEVPGAARAFLQTDIDWNYKTEPQKNAAAGHVNRELAWPSGKALGGSSIFNAMFHVRGHKENYNDWFKLGAMKWSYIDVLPFFKMLEGNREHVNPAYHGFHGPISVEKPKYDSELKKAVYEAATMFGYQIVDSNAEKQKGFFDIQANLRDSRRCSTAKAYLVPAENRNNLDILTNAFVKKIQIENNRAVGVVFDFEGEERVVRAKNEVILSAGTVNSAQILMLSGIGPRKHLEEMKIPVIADLPVGENFQDHIGTFIPFEMSSKIKSIDEKLSDDGNIKEYINNRKGPLASCQGVGAIAFLSNNQSAPASGKPDHEIYFMEGSNNVAKNQMNIKPEVFEQVFGPYANKTTFWCFSQVCHPRSRGSVTLRSIDPYEPPRIDPNYFDDERDVKDIVEGLKTCLKITRSQPLLRKGTKPFTTVYPGCENFQKDEEKYLECIARTIGMTLSHQVGTAKMGSLEDPTTVVDSLLRVKTIEGLRVVDASVMPLVPSGNTNVPTIMIAEKASEMIKWTTHC